MEENASIIPIITAPVGFAPPPMPPEIAKAIVAVMKKVHAISKDQINAQGGYKYVSVDQFYEEVREPMADAGLITLTHEASVTLEDKHGTDRYGNKKSSTWMACVYHIWLYHESGASYGPIPRQIKVVATGPQSYGSGPSFVEKYFLRGLFKIATGDMDVDAHSQDGLPSASDAGPIDGKLQKWSGREGANARDAEARRKLDASGYCDEAIAALKAVQTTQLDLRAWWANEKSSMEEHFAGKDDPLYQRLLATFKEHGATLPVGGDAATPQSKPGLPEDEFSRIAKWAAADLASCLDAGAVAVTMESFRDAAKMSAGQLAHLDSLRDERLAEFKAKK